MNGEQRRDAITTTLREVSYPVSATTLAKEFGVSRQVIVGDVALIRAAGLMVRATSRGYLLEGPELGQLFRGQLVCQHNFEQTEAELMLIVKLEGVVLDVTVEHPIYGELTGNLDIKTAQDVANFMALFQQGEVRLLSDLTGGIHLHTIACRDKDQFDLIKLALDREQLLYQET